MSLLHKFDDVVSQFMNDTPVSSDGPQMTLKAVIVCQVVMKLLDATVPDHRVSVEIIFPFLQKLGVHPSCYH